MLSYSMNEDEQNPPADTKSETPYVPRKDRRTSRFIKAEQRRRAAQAKDQRFYSMMFSVVGVMIAVVFGIAFLVMFGNSVDVGGLGNFTQPWLFGGSILELGGLVIVALFGVYMWLRMKKR